MNNIHHTCSRYIYIHVLYNPGHWYITCTWIIFERDYISSYQIGCTCKLNISLYKHFLWCGNYHVFFYNKLPRCHYVQLIFYYGTFRSIQNYLYESHKSWDVKTNNVRCISQQRQVGLALVLVFYANGYHACLFNGRETPVITKKQTINKGKMNYRQTRMNGKRMVDICFFLAFSFDQSGFGHRSLHFYILCRYIDP